MEKGKAWRIVQKLSYKASDNQNWIPIGRHWIVVVQNHKSYCTLRSIKFKARGQATDSESELSYSYSIVFIGKKIIFYSVGRIWRYRKHPTIASPVAIVVTSIATLVATRIYGALTMLQAFCQALHMLQCSPYYRLVICVSCPRFTEGYTSNQRVIWDSKPGLF